MYKVCKKNINETFSHKMIEIHHQGTKEDMTHWTLQKSVENDEIFKGSNGFEPWI